VGKSLAKSTQNIYNFFSEIGLKDIEKYVVVDVHTGLGPLVDTMLIRDEEKDVRIEQRNISRQVVKSKY